MKKTMLLSVCVGAIAILLPTIAHATPGDLYVTDEGNVEILKYAPNGALSSFVANQSPHLAGLAFDRSGDLFVVEANSQVIFKFTPTGVRTIFASGLTNPFGLVFDGSGNLFVSEHSTISKFTPAGTKSTFASGLNMPGFLAFDNNGNLYATDNGSGKIFKFTPEGSKSTFASGLSSPSGLAFDNLGNLYVTTSVSGTILPHGTIFKFNRAGSRSTFSSDLKIPTAIAFDSSGSLFVADRSSRTIEKFSPEGMKSTFASVFLPASLAFEPVTEKLRNISARGFVQTGDKVLIGGFVLGGSSLNNNAVIVRALGLSLFRAGITNPLRDPTLELHDSSGAIIAFNDNWQTTQNARILDSGLAPTDVHESAIYAILPAGAYTAIVRGVANTTGVAVLEVYSIDR